MMPYQAQLPLFNRQAPVRVVSEQMSRYCQRCGAVVVRHIPGDLTFPCETLLADFLANRKTRPVSLPPFEPIQVPDDEFRQHPPIDRITPASACL